MKKKSLFNLLIIMVIVAFLGLGLTITLAVIMGGNATNIFDISAMNLFNVGIVLLIGLISLCLILAVFLLIFVKKSVLKILSILLKTKSGRIKNELSNHEKCRGKRNVYILR